MNREKLEVRFVDEILRKEPWQCNIFQDDTWVATIDIQTQFL